MRPRRFLAVEIVRETIANLAAHRIPTAFVMGTALLVGLGVPLFTAVEVGTMERVAIERVARGSNVLSITAADRAPLSASRCEHLGLAEGVLGSGGLIGNHTGRTTDGLPVSVVRVTPGYPSILWPGEQLHPDRGASLVAGSVFAARSSLYDEGAVHGIDVGRGFGTMHVDQVARPSSRSSFADRAVFVVEPAVGSVSECLVEAEDGALADVESLAVGWFEDWMDPTVAPMVVATDDQEDLGGRLAARSSFHGPHLGFVLCALVGLASMHARRSEIALYRNLGMTPPGFLILITIEVMASVILPVAAGTGMAFALGEWSDLQLFLAGLDVLRLVDLLILIPLPSLVTLPRRAGLEALRGE